MRNRVMQFLRSSEALALLAGAIVLLVPLLPPGRAQWIASVIAAVASASLAYILFALRARKDSQDELETRDARRHRNFQLKDSHEVHGKLDEILRVQTVLRVSDNVDDEFKRRSLPLRLTLLGLNLHNLTDFWHEGPQVVNFVNAFPSVDILEKPTAEQWNKHRGETLRIFKEEFAPDIRAIAEELKATDSSDAHQERVRSLVMLADSAALHPELMIGVMLLIAALADELPKSDLPRSGGLVHHV